MKAVAAFFVAATGILATNAALNQRHHELAERSLNTAEASTSLEKRSFSGKATWFIPNQGACGKWNTGSDLIVALNQPQYDGGSHCFKFLDITYQGKTVRAQVTDLCPECHSGSLDMTQGLFKKFESLGTGEFTMSWVWADGSGGGGGGGSGGDNGGDNSDNNDNNDNGDKSKDNHPKAQVKVHTTTKHTSTHHSTTKHTSTKKTTSTKPTSTRAPATTATATPAPTAVIDNIANVNNLIVQLRNIVEFAGGSD